MGRIIKINKKKINLSSFGISEVEKSAQEGVYIDSPLNRKLGRVGMTYSQYTDKSKKNGDNDTSKKDDKGNNGGGFSVKTGKNGLEIVNPKDSFMNVNDDQHFGQFKDQKAAVGIVTNSMNAFNEGVKKILGNNYDKVKGNLAYEFGINRELNGSKFDGSNLIEPMNLGGNSEEVVGNLVSDEQMEQIDNLAENIGNKIASDLNKLHRISDNEDEGEVSNNSSNASKNNSPSDSNPFKGNKEENNNLSPIEKNREFIKNYKFDQAWKEDSNYTSNVNPANEKIADEYASGKRDLKDLYHEGLQVNDNGITIRLNTQAGVSKKSDLKNRMPFEAHGYDYLTLNKSDFKSEKDYEKAKSSLIKEYLSSDIFSPTSSGKYLTNSPSPSGKETSQQAKERQQKSINSARGFYTKMKNNPGIKTSFKENKVIDSSFNNFW